METSDIALCIAVGEIVVNVFGIYDTIDWVMSNASYSSLAALVTDSRSYSKTALAIYTITCNYIYFNTIMMHYITALLTLV